MSVWIALGTGLVTLTIILVGVFTFKQGVRHPESKWFGLFCLFYPAYILSNTILDEWIRYLPVLTPRLRLFGEWVAYFMAIAGCLSVMCFLAFFDQVLSRFVRRPMGLVMGMQAGIAGFLVYSALTVYPVGNTSTLYDVPKFFPYYSATLMAVFLYVFGMYFLALPKVGNQKPAFRAVGIGLVAFFLGVSICDLLLPIFGQFQWLWVGRIGGFALAGAMFVAMTSFQLLDHRTAIHYTVYWVLSLVGGIALLLGLVWVVVNVGWMPAAFETYAYVGATGVVGLVLVWGSGVQPWIASVLFRRRYQLEQEVVVFQQQLSALSTVPELVDRLRTLMHRVLAGSRIFIGVPIPNELDWQIDGFYQVNRVSRERIAVWVSEPTKERAAAWFANQGVSVIHVQPLQVKDELVGVVIVGEKRNLKPLSSQELMFLAALAPSLAIYIKNAVLYGELRAQSDEMGVLQRQLVTLQQEMVDAFQDETITSGVLHEVKNTHLAMGGLIQQFLDRKELDLNLVRDVLAEVGRQSEYLYLFSQNLLYSNQLGALPFRADVVRVVELIEIGLRTHDLLLKDNQVSVKIQVPESDAMRVDRGRFQLVISNLIHNAAKYRGQRLDVVGQAVPTGYELRFVSTQFQVLPCLPIVPGVGLRICDRIVAQHGGRFNIEGNHAGVAVQMVLPN